MHTDYIRGAFIFSSAHGCHVSAETEAYSEWFACILGRGGCPWLAARSWREQQVDEHNGVGGARHCPSGGGGGRLVDHHGAQLLAFLERHDAVAGAGSLPDAERLLWPELCPDRADHAHHADDLVLAAAGGRARHRSPAAALFAGDGHGCHPGRLAAAGACRELSAAVAGGDDGRHGVGGISPGSLAGGADGIGRAPRARPVGVSGRRQYRLVAGPDARGFYRNPERSGQHRLVFVRGPAGDGGAAAGRQLVPARALGAGAAAIDAFDHTGRACRAARSAGPW